MKISLIAVISKDQDIRNINENTITVVKLDNYCKARLNEGVSLEELFSSHFILLSGIIEVEFYLPDFEELRKIKIDFLDEKIKEAKGLIHAKEEEKRTLFSLTHQA